MDFVQIIISYNPHWTQQELLVIGLVIVIATLVAWRLLIRKRIVLSQAVSGVLLLVVLVTIFGTTVFTRIPGIENPRYKLQLFWSWQRVFAGDYELLEENLLNVLLLFPVGMLLPLALHKQLHWWQGLCVGAVISAIIELCQLIFSRGLFEFDDIVHNAIGCMLGCMVAVWWMKRRAKASPG